MNYQILTDSTSDLPLEIVKKYNLEIVNFTVHMNGKELIDDLGETFDKEDFFQQLKKGATPTTSQVNTGTYYELFKTYVDKNIPLLYLAFSSELSGSYQSAVSALNMIKEEVENPQITIVDTQAASLGEGLLVVKASKMKEEGKSLEEVAQWIEENKSRVHSWVTVDDIRHLQRGGRISATSAMLGSLLSVKPIIVVTKAGKLVPYAKVRGRKKSLQMLVDQTLKGMTHPKEETIFIGHIGAQEDAEWFKQKLVEAVQPREVMISTFGPAIGSHTGYGSLAVFSMGQEREVE